MWHHVVVCFEWYPTCNISLAVDSESQYNACDKVTVLGHVNELCHMVYLHGPT